MAFSSVILNVNGREVVSTEVTLQDIYDLYQIFVDTYGYFPRAHELDSKHNMPQMRIVQRVLSLSGVPYTDLCLKFGKTSHARSVAKDYPIYLERLKDYVEAHGCSPSSKELTGLGFPSAKWLIQNCGTPTICTWLEFLEYYNLPACKTYTENEVIELLRTYQNELGRPISSSDLGKVGSPVSNIVITRLFGSWGQCKEQLGLLPTLPQQPKPFEFYKDRLTSVVAAIVQETGRHEITWRDIESPQYSAPPCVSHKTYISAFAREGKDVREFLKELGVTMAPSLFSFHYTFDDGELALSSMEYDMSLFLRNCGLRYQHDYIRDYPYKKFTKGSGKINCDYYFPEILGGCCVEVAGIIYEPDGADWRRHQYSSQQENTYRDKMIRKERLLIEAGVPFLFLFRDDMHDGSYINKISGFLNCAPLDEVV